MTGVRDSATYMGAGKVRTGLGIDAAALDAWFEENIPDSRPPISIEQFRGGQSNPTYRLTDSQGQRFVLRRKPPGKLLASAHAVDREYHVIKALKPLGLPVPEPLALCMEDTPAGTPFYVMEYVEGRIFWEPTIADVEKEERAQIYDAMNATIAELHGVDYVAAGLGDYGKPGDYFARQISRWTRQYESDPEAGRFAEMDRLIEWLPGNIPAGEETSIVHGDFRLDNLIFDPKKPRVLAILDWELSTLGSPLSDFAYNCLPYCLSATLFNGMADKDIAALGIPSLEMYVATYCRRTGRETIDNFAFYVAFNLFRLAAILHGIAGRVVRGNAASRHAEKRAKLTQPMAAAGWVVACQGLKAVGTG